MAWSGTTRRWLIVAAIAGVMLAIAAGVALFASRTTGRRAAADAQLQRALDRVEDADEVVLDLDTTLREPVDVGAAEDARTLIGRIPDASRRLAQARRSASDARPALPPDRQRVADAIVTGAGAREEMLDEGEKILQARIVAADALDAARPAWEDVRRAEALSSEAAERYNLHTRAGVTASAQLSSQAASALASATAGLERAEQAMPEAEFEPFLRYVREKTALVRRSQSIDELWLSGKVEQANDALREYNEAEERVVALAKQLPDSPAAVVAAAYDRATSDVADRYFAARERARRADERIAADAETSTAK